MKIHQKQPSTKTAASDPFGTSASEFNNADWSAGFELDSNSQQQSVVVDPFASGVDPFAMSPSTIATSVGGDFDPFGLPSTTNLPTSASGFGDDNWAAFATTANSNPNAESININTNTNHAFNNASTALNAEEQAVLNNTAATAIVTTTKIATTTSHKAPPRPPPVARPPPPLTSSNSSNQLNTNINSTIESANEFNDSNNEESSNWAAFDDGN